MAEEPKDKLSEAAEKPVELKEEAPVVTQHYFGGRDVEAKTGRLPLFDEKGGIDALVFYVAYTKADSRPLQKRPIMFVFNGGPGSPSVWLHMGALGPMRAPMLQDGSLPAPPYTLQENAHSWLDLFDLVFVDPVGTGYSRAKDDKTGAKFWGLQGDLDSMSEFIRLFLAREGRTSSPVYLCGESYGTTRCAGLAGLLTEKGILLNGVVLISLVLNFQTLIFSKGNDLPYALFLPTYAAAASFHGAVEGGDGHLDRAREFALGDYWLALAKGSRLGLEEKKAIAARMASLIGLDEDYILGADLRINIHDFCKELLRRKGLVVGRLDSRIKGIEDTLSGSRQSPESDPSMDILMGPYMSLFGQHVRDTLGYKTDLVYEVFGGVKKDWEWGSTVKGFPDTSDRLRKAMSRNPHMKVLVCNGHYDLATPFYATEYTLSHLGLDPRLLGSLTVKEYPAGHMMYIDESCLAQLRKDVGDWASSTLPAG